MIIKKDFFENFPFMETERLVFIEPDLKYTEDIYEIISDPYVAEYDWFYPQTEMHFSRKFISMYIENYENNEEITWMLFDKDKRKVIGIICLGNFDDVSCICEIGFYLNRKFWNMGYGTEAIKKITEYAFEKIGINRIEAFITEGNISSERVLEKSGFQREAFMRERDFIKGKFVNTVLMAIIMRDYNKNMHD
ncbi:MAG: GNAT family N-acetyltransferase [Thermotogae bacterium]|nr:GNAT family N-acetyltransferase [Thermotogota bacterium]MCP5465747.1 GNAT family N-acetyltransferase [Thermotogota bacterium]HOO75110.1 GNAT family protein [Tepiditoga sp.]